MNTKCMSLLAFSLATSVCAWAANPGNHGKGTEESRPEGFHFLDNRLTIKPYVALSYTYDSNIDTTRHADADNIFCINPGADFTWTGDRWELVGTIWYRYNAYTEYSDEMGENSYGESLAYRWTNISETDHKGWNLLLSERYQFINQSDSLLSNQGRGLWRDREYLDLTGVIERRFNDRLHANVMGQYKWLDYHNDTARYAPLYGWSEYSVGVEAGYVLSKWTDLLINAGYSDYTQKKAKNGYYNYSNDSSVWSVQVGLGTHATERITYRALMGVSMLDYGGKSNTDSGWTYELSANWKITKQWHLSVLGRSYYMPSERELGRAIKVYSLSGGMSYLTMGNRLSLHGDVAWRYEDSVFSAKYRAYVPNYDEDILSIRLGADYKLNRWTTLFVNFIWEEEWSSRDYDDFNYDRFRGTLGVRFHY